MTRNFHEDRDLDRARAVTPGFVSRLLSAANRAGGTPIEADLGRYWRTVDSIHVFRKGLNIKAMI